MQGLFGHGCLRSYLTGSHAGSKLLGTTSVVQHTFIKYVCVRVQVHRSGRGGTIGSLAVMLDRERSWTAMVSFYETVISQKKTAMRARKVDNCSHPLRRRHEWQQGPVCPFSFAAFSRTKRNRSEDPTLIAPVWLSGKQLTTLPIWRSRFTMRSDWVPV